MKEQFVPYEIAKKLEEKGFDEECLAGYYVFGGNKEQGGDEQTEPELFMDGYDIDYREAELNMHAYYYCDAPLWQQVVDWLREEKNINIIIDKVSDSEYVYHNYFQELITGKGRIKFGAGQDEDIEIEYTYFQARQAAIEHALTLI